MKIVVTKKELVNAVINQVKGKYGDAFEIKDIHFLNNERPVSIIGAEIIVNGGNE